jgi:hypothetical protein
MEEPHWAHVHYPKIDYQNATTTARRRRSPAQQPRRGRSRAGEDLREAGHFTGRAEAPGGRGRGCGVRQREREDHLPSGAEGEGHHLLQLQRCGAEPPGPDQEVPRQRGAAHGQLLRRAQQRRVQRWQLLLHPAGRALPHGAEHLLPHQRGHDRPVRAHAADRRRRRLRELPRRLHRPHPRRAPVARRRG